MYKSDIMNTLHGISWEHIPSQSGEPLVELTMKIRMAPENALRYHESDPDKFWPEQLDISESQFLELMQFIIAEHNLLS